MKKNDRTSYSQLKKMPYLTSISCSSQGCASGTCDSPAQWLCVSKKKNQKFTLKKELELERS